MTTTGKIKYTIQNFKR